jgi:molecular chaperone DnaK
VFYKVSEKLYSQANPQGAQGFDPNNMGGANGANGANGNGQQYYDADYEVVDDDDNNK